MANVPKATIRDPYSDIPEILDAEGRPSVSSLIWHSPVGGKIVNMKMWQGVQLVLFRDKQTKRESWHVPMPPVPIPCSYVNVGPGEGIAGVHDKVVKVEAHDVTIREETRRIPVFVAVHGEMQQRARDIEPDMLGYLKTDFEVVWADDSRYKGRFDLQRGGVDGGQTFNQSLRHRVLCYSGLYCPPHMSRKAYDTMLSRDTNDYQAFCRRLLAHYEL